MTKQTRHGYLALPAAVWLALVATLALVPVQAQTNPPAAVADEWPRQLKAKAGKAVIYQPQLESFQGDKGAYRAAVSVQTSAMKAPLFGVVWFDTRTATDRDTRTVEFKEIKVGKIKFPNAKPERERRLAEFLEKEIATWPKPTLSLDRLLAALAEVEREQAGSGLRNDPPLIRFTQEPSMLVLIDGEPILRDVEGFAVKRVVNTPFVLLFYPADSRYYLTGDALWFGAPDFKGPWQTLESPPAEVANAARRIAEAEVPTQVRPETLKAAGIPKILVATEPTELIVTDGEPQFAPLPGTDLLYLENTGRDVFQALGTQQYYLLLSGRWFASPSLENGPWSYVPPDKLPAGFYRIPAGSAKGHVLAFVPDTPQANEAVADAQIPVTAAIPRTATTRIGYDGAPKFQDIEGTRMQYAVNTAMPVLKVQDKYYAVDRAVWYESDQPDGAYTVATSVPQEIYSMPPSSPVYSVKYVQVYDSTPQTVTMGYTPGYTGTYVSGDTVVYGTGYTYPPYISTAAYYPTPVTYGYAPVYNPWQGAWSFLAGAAFGFVAGAADDDWWGDCCGWHGDVDVDINRDIDISRDYFRDLNVDRRDFQSLRIDRQDFRNSIYKNRETWAGQLQNNRRDRLNQRVSAWQRGERPRASSLEGRQRRAGEAGTRAERQQARRQGEGPIAREGRSAAPQERIGERQGRPEARLQERPGAAQARPEQRRVAREARSQPPPAARTAQREQRLAQTRPAQPKQRARPADLGGNNVFADREGNVYRRTGQGWQQRDPRGWSRPETRPQAGFAQQRTSLDRDFGARARGAERAQSFQRTQRGGGGRELGRGGGGHRGGGGSRR